MMYSYLMLSTAQAFPTVHVTECRETTKATLFDQKADIAVAVVDNISKMANKLVGDDKLNPNITGELKAWASEKVRNTAIRKIVNDLGDHARPLLFERVECKDGSGPDFQPCSDLYGETVCEQVALRKMQDRASGIKNIFNKESTCKAIDRLDATATAVSVAPGVAMTCNMEDSLESMELYVARGTIQKWIFYPKCPEGLQLEDKSMKDAVYDEDQKTFTLTTGWGWNKSEEDVTDKVKCIKKPRKEAAQAVKEDLVNKLKLASKKAPSPFNDHAQTLQEELEKMTPEEILVHYDELMADPAAKMMEFKSSQIAKDIAKDIAKETVSSTIDNGTETVKDKANEALEKLKQQEWVQQIPEVADIIENTQNDVVDHVVDQLGDTVTGLFDDWLR